MAKSRRHLYRQTPMTILLLRPARYNIAYNGIYKMTIGNGDINALRDSVRRFVAAAVLPCVQQIENDGTMPRALWRRMGGMGLLGITVGEECGGAAMGYVAHCAVMEEVSRASASVGLSFGAHSNLCVNQLYRHGNENQKRKYLPKLISGDHIAPAQSARDTLLLSQSTAAEKTYARAGESAVFISASLARMS